MKKLISLGGLLLSFCVAQAVWCAEQKVAEAPEVLFILDGSGSMWEQMKEQPKIAIAKDVMSKMVQELPKDVQAGLVVYGHRKERECSDIELLVPPGSTDRDALLSKIQSINPKGKTPITASLQLAADALSGVASEATIILVSDGKETCAEDPCSLVKTLRENGLNAVIHVVGFGVKKVDADQLSCIAKAGGGNYYSADSKGELGSAMRSVRKVVEIKMPELHKAKMHAMPKMHAAPTLHKPTMHAVPTLHKSTMHATPTLHKPQMHEAPKVKSLPEVQTSVEQQAQEAQSSPQEGTAE